MAKPKKPKAVAAVAIPARESLPPIKRPDLLTHANFVAPSTIELEFADHRRFSLDAAVLGMPMDRIDWPTMKAAPSGENVLVQQISGSTIPIDSASLRYLVDEQYGATIDKSIRDLHMTPAQAEEASRLSKLTRDPRWKDVGDEDDLFE